MRQIKLLGQSSEIFALINFADSVITVGTTFIGHMKDNHGFEPRYFGMKQNNNGAQQAKKSSPWWKSLLLRLVSRRRK